MVKPRSEVPLVRLAGKVWHPLDLPKDYHTPPARVPSCRRYTGGSVESGTQTARGRAVPGRGDATQLPAWGSGPDWAAGAVDQPGAGVTD